jgi:hypothetical protein
MRAYAGGADFRRGGNTGMRRAGNAPCQQAEPRAHLFHGSRPVGGSTRSYRSALSMRVDHDALIAAREMQSANRAVA